MRFHRSFFPVFCAFFVALPAWAANECKHNPKLVGACFVVHGNLHVSNGTPDLRIRKIGTRRILGIVDITGEPEGESEAPANAPLNVMKKLSAFGTFTNVYGDYEVCPLTREQPGVMQMVCIESGSQMVTKPN